MISVPSPSNRDSATAMPPAQSPPRPDSTDVSGPPGSLQQDASCTPGPLHSQSPLRRSSAACPPRPTTTMTCSTSPATATASANAPMATAFADSVPSQSQDLHPAPALMSFDASAASAPGQPQWPSHHHGDCHGETMMPLTPLSAFGQDYLQVSQHHQHHLPHHYMAASTAPAFQYGYGPNGLPYNANYGLSYSAANPIPRSYTTGGSSSNGGIEMTGPPLTDAYPPSAYLIEQPPMPHDVQEPLKDEFDGVKVEAPDGYPSPYGSDAATRSSTPFDSGKQPPHEPKSGGTGDDGAIDKEQPYAQLIWRALMEAPGHTMILRDIYEWFKNNTDKAADKETKGWQNSIRHNLSMNGAFEKVDQPCEESRKGFMWRLTEDAINTGVKSTTRYRSKQPNKRSHRTASQYSHIQRQQAGAKGGQAARRSAKQRRTNRTHEASAHSLTSVPMGYYSPELDSLDELAGGMHMQYPPSPYYTCSSSSEVDFDGQSSVDGYGSPMLAPGLVDMYSSHPYPPSMPGAAYVLPMDPAEPLFYPDSPADSRSPTPDEPLTPSSTAEWDMETGLPTTAPFIFDDINHYREF